MSWRGLLLGGVLLAGGASAQSVALMPGGSVYADARGGALKAPEGVACGGDGRVVVADSANGRLVSYSFEDGSLVGGTEIKLAAPGYPTRVELGLEGRIWVLDRRRRRIHRLDSAGKPLGHLELSSGVNPGSFKVGAAETLYVLDVRGSKVLVSSPKGELLREVALPRGGAHFTDLAVDPAGTLYAVDAVGAVVWTADKDAAAFKPLTKSLKGYMNFPTHLIASRGRLWVVDQHGSGIVFIGLDGTFQGRQLSIGWGEGLVYYPSQLCLDRDGVAFVADRGNNRVQYFFSAR